MFQTISSYQRRRSMAARVALIALTAAGIASADESSSFEPRQQKTASPIKHVIILIGENRTFDNVYGTYAPRNGQHVENLLSKGIVKPDGSPGPNKEAAKQFQIGTINPPSYFVSTDKLVAPNKAPYAPFLPTPEAGSASPRPVTLQQLQKDPPDSFAPFDANTFLFRDLATLEPSLEPGDLRLLTTGATGLTVCPLAPKTVVDPTDPPQACHEPDTRIRNFDTLLNTVFQITSSRVPYDTYTGDMVHRFFHMWQQSDCDTSAATKGNPAGCRNDLYPYVGIARGDDSGSNSMGFYNVLRGDAPLFKHLADEFTMSDNYHQPVMGGTAVQHQMIAAADSIPWEQVGTFPAVPPTAQVANPNPKSATNDAYVTDARWTKCGDETQPGIKPIADYLKTLPWRPDRTASNCEDGKYYMINNTNPAFLANGQIDTAAVTSGTAVPPSTLRTIGDALNEKRISWAYYGGGYNAAVRFNNGSTDPFDVLIGTGGDFYCEICNPFEYSTSIMGNATQRGAHIKDTIDFFDGLDNGRLPSVAYVKPDSFLDGHPASSKLNLLEGMIDKILDKLHKHPELFEDTAFLITFDEGGGYWDSGFFQPIDFFGDGPRIPMIAVSPFSKGGRVVHSYADHASVVKFIEHNWGLKPLTRRSRDNLPNPRMSERNPYVPENMPALGDLFDMFDFDRHD